MRDEGVLLGIAEEFGSTVATIRQAISILDDHRLIQMPAPVQIT
jgi:DNA-binding GntR family transcriptional regulator